MVAFIFQRLQEGLIHHRPPSCVQAVHIGQSSSLPFLIGFDGLRSEREYRSIEIIDIEGVIRSQVRDGLPHGFLHRVDGPARHGSGGVEYEDDLLASDLTVFRGFLRLGEEGEVSALLTLVLIHEESDLRSV